MTRSDEGPARGPQRDPSRDPSRDPWRAPVSVVQIPDSGLHREIEADAPARAAIAEAAGLRDIASVRAAFDLSHRSGGRVHVAGRVQAKVGQTCVVTLEPIENGMIDLGRLATDVLYLAIDPYPRKQGAVFEPQLAVSDPEDHPFAALKALQAGPDKSTPGSGKRKGK